MTHTPVAMPIKKGGAFSLYKAIATEEEIRIPSIVKNVFISHNPFQEDRPYYFIYITKLTVCQILKGRGGEKK